MLLIQPEITERKLMLLIQPENTERKLLKRHLLIKSSCDALLRVTIVVGDEEKKHCQFRT